MITKNEMMEKAQIYGLSPNIVEKDYVLSWILAGISSQKDFNEDWIFKGGTCLKKCFFDEYRFSEDLDYTLKNAAHLNATFLTNTFALINEWIYKQSGIRIISTLFEEYINPHENLSIQGKLEYIGPLQRRGSAPKIKLDLTCDEMLVFSPEKRPVYHSYSDIPPGKLFIYTYTIEEIFSEKLRTLIQRLRPRDLYDVVNLYTDKRFAPDQNKVLEALQKKCAFKNVALPSMILLNEMPEKQDLINGWSEMLAHQVKHLEPYENYWKRLPEIFDWIYGS
jgi:predicted nucleotidyltransferase component of viral defense system